MSEAFPATRLPLYIMQASSAKKVRAKKPPGLLGEPLSGLRVPGRRIKEIVAAAAVAVAVLAASVLGGCGGEVPAQGQEEEMEASLSKREEINDVRYNMAVRQLRKVAEEAAEWKEENGGGEGDFSQLVWTDIAPDAKGPPEDFQTYEGDSYTRKGWYTARITGRNPLVFVVDMERWPRRLTFTVPGTDSEAITMKEEATSS